MPFEKEDFLMDEIIGIYSRNCDECNNRYTSISPHSRFCSDKCKQTAYRRRKANGEPVSRTAIKLEYPLDKKFYKWVYGMVDSVEILERESFISDLKKIIAKYRK